MAERKYWLFKSEPTSYSFNDLSKEENQTAEWDRSPELPGPQLHAG